MCQNINKHLVSQKCPVHNYYLCFSTNNKLNAGNFFGTIAVFKFLGRKKTKETKTGHIYFFTFEGLTRFFRKNVKKKIFNLNGYFLTYGPGT